MRREKSKNLIPIFNPLLLIVLQTMLFLSVSHSEKLDIPDYVFFVYPILFVLLAYMPLRAISGTVKPSVWRMSSSAVRLLTALLVAVSALILAGLANLMFIYGGPGPFVTSILGDGGLSLALQSDLSSVSQFSKVALYCSYFLTPLGCLQLMIMQRKGRGRRWRIFLLILSALILLSVSWIISARVIFGQYLIAMFVTLIYTRRLRLRESVAVVAVILLTLAYFDYAQLANKSSGVKAATGQSGLSDLTKYYTASLDNAVHLLNDRPDTGQSARGYWLLRSALNMPLLGKLNQSLYRQLGQEMPITTRQGDFDYARRLGVDPQFNTFTFFGYNYLDWGYFGGVLATTLVFCLYLLVYFFSLRNSLYAVLSMGLVSIAVLETFRTQVVYSDITIAYLIILAVLYLANRRRPGKERA